MCSMKYVIVFALVLPFANLQESIKFISTSADEQDEKYDIKIIKNDDKKCQDLETLNLEEMNLRFIKETIVKCNGIRHISLQKNFLENIPQVMLKNVPYLYCLNLSNNYINLYNIHTLQHQYLQVLDISYQNMPNIYENMIPDKREFEEEFEEDTDNIEKFMVFNTTNMLLPNLKYLYLSGNIFSAVTHDFKISFPQLSHLYLININAFTLDEEFFQKIPNSLQILHLENNQFKNLELKSMTNITALYLDHNPIENINITSNKLRILSLSNCTKLNIGYFNTPYLEQLDLSKSNLYNTYDIHFEIQLLQTLLLDHNKLIEVPMLTILQLSELSLRYNMIQDISANRFTNLISLKKLSLKGNEIKTIEKDAFSGLKKLEYLDLSENKLKNLPHNWQLSITNLQYLNVNSNNFTTIFDLPIRYISLKHLSIKNNFFKKISTRELDALPNMTTIHLA